MTKEQVLKLKPTKFFKLAIKARHKRGVDYFNRLVKWYLYERSWRGKTKLERDVGEVFKI